MVPADFLDFIRSCSNVDFLFVDDGSSDNTPEILGMLDREGNGRVAVLKLGVNSGKAEAVRRGGLHCISSGKYEYIGYWDADLATPLSEINRFLAVFSSKPDVSMVIGSRIRKMGSRVERIWYRHYLGRFFATAASVMLKMPIYDTQCGAKIMRAGFAAPLFNEPFNVKWLFDIELFSRAIYELGNEGVKKAVYEIPLDAWKDIAGSKLRLVNFLATPVQLFWIWKLYNLPVKGNRR